MTSMNDNDKHKLMHKLIIMMTSNTNDNTECTILKCNTVNRNMTVHLLQSWELLWKL